MRISELAETTGLSVPTIKYYLREDLLHPGTRVTDRLSTYDWSHVRRLGLLRLLREVADIPVERLKAMVAVANDPRATVHDMFAQAADALAPTPAPAGPQRAVTRQLADELIARAGWTEVRPESVDRDSLATVLEAVLRYSGDPPDPAGAEPYLQAADQLARHELAHMDGTKDRLDLLEEMVVGQTVFGQLLHVLRRLAEEHYSALRFG